MPDFSLPSFKYGMDWRRAAAAGAVSTLRDLENGHISRGGDIQRAKAFVPRYTCPSGCFGLVACASSLFTFGSESAPTMPPGVTYQQLVGESGVHATGALTFSANPSASSTIVLNGTTWTFVSALTSGNQLLLASTLADTLTNALTTLAETTDANTQAMTYTASATVLTCTAVEEGTAGNSLTIQGSSGANCTPTTSTDLTGGSTGSAQAMMGVITAVSFLGIPYVIAEYADGNIYHFYNGARVTDWDAIAQANCTQNSLAAYMAQLANGDSAVFVTSYGTSLLITSLEAGVATNVSASITGSETAPVTTVQAAVAAAPETPATGSVTITTGAADGSQVSGVTVNGVQLMAAPVPWIGSNAIAAAAVAAQINNRSTTSGYNATASGAVVTIAANPGQGTTPNGFAVAATATGSVSVSTTNMSGGVAAVTAVAQAVTVVLGGTFAPSDQFTLTIGSNTYKTTGQASGTGLTAFVYLNRIYSCANTQLQYCTLANPSDWHNTDPSSGAGFINIANESDGADRLVGVCNYASYAPVFTARNVVLYELTADATEVTLFQSMQNQGSIAGQSFQSYATTDVFYLDISGIRSLRERDTTFAAYAADVGSAVDTPVQRWIAAAGPVATANAVSVIEPLDGRYMLAIGERIWVYSYFPSTQVGAWSYYSPGFTVQAFAVIKEQLYCYDGTTIYLYGGLNGETYPAAGDNPVSFTTPFMSAGDAGNFKIWTSLDVIATGVWTCTVYTDPNNAESTVNGGTIVNNTYLGPTDNLAGRSQLIALEMTCSGSAILPLGTQNVPALNPQIAPGYADFSSITLNYLQKAAK